MSVTTEDYWNGRQERKQLERACEKALGDELMNDERHAALQPRPFSGLERWRFALKVAPVSRRFHASTLQKCVLAVHTVFGAKPLALLLSDTL